MKSHLILSFLALSVFWVACDKPQSDGSNPAASKSMAVALDEAFRQPRRFDRIAGLTAALSNLNAENVAQAQEAFEREYWWLRDIETQLFMEAWTSFDPIGALDYAAHWPIRSHRPEAIAAVIQSWAVLDPVAAADKVSELKAGYPRNSQKMVENLLTGWSQSAQDGAVEYIANSPEVGLVHQSMVLAGAQTRRLGTPAVLDWADTVMSGEFDEELKKNIFRRVTGMAARLDPVLVAEWIEKHGDQDYTNRASAILSERWVSTDPEAAIQWVSTAIPSDEQYTVLRTAFAKWITEDFPRGSEFMEASADELQSDPAYSAYATILAQRDPEAALPWADRIDDEQIRMQVLERIGSAWYRRNSEGAESWLETSELDEESRERVRQAPKGRRQSPLRGR